MEARRQEPEIFIEGIDKVIKQGLGKHKELLAQTKVELASFQQARSHEIARKKHYARQIGQGKYNDDALRRSIEDIRINVRHMSDKVDLAQEKIEHHTLIVDTLTDQLKEYDRRHAAFNRLLQQAREGNQSDD